MVIETKAKRLRVLDPTAEAVAATATMAPRPKSLEGKMVGFLDNSKLNADKFLDFMEQVLKERYGVAGVLRWRKPNASQPAPAPILDELAERCQLAITAIGD